MKHALGVRARQPCVVLLSLALFTIMLLAALAPGQPVSAAPVVTDEAISALTLTSITLRWTTNEPGDSTVFYSTKATIDSTSSSVTLPALVTNHVVTVRGLPPGATIVYQVRSAGPTGISSRSAVAQATLATLEIAGRGQTASGAFSALTVVPPDTTRIEWSADNFATARDVTPASGLSPTIARVVAFGGVVPAAPAAAYTIAVRFNGGTLGSASATIRADSTTVPVFTDVSPGTASPYAQAIYELAARGIIGGYNDGTGRVGPLDRVVRAQSAALITRALGWTTEQGRDSFRDQGTVDANLWGQVRVLSSYGIARGYGDGTFHPLDPVMEIQSISLITRAMIAKGFWQYHQDDPTIYPDVPTSSGERLDVVTYVAYLGLLPGTTSTGAGAWPTWNQPAERRWIALALWQSVRWRELLQPGVTVPVVHQCGTPVGPRPAAGPSPARSVIRAAGLAAKRGGPACAAPRENGEAAT